MHSLFARSKKQLLHVLLAAIIGALGGVICAAFLGSLNWATTTRIDHDWIIYLLPLAGLVVGLAYYKLGDPITGGTGLVLDAVHVPGAQVPTRMAPMIYGGSVLGHLAGASVGREGAVVQIIASLSDSAARKVKANDELRRVILVIAVAAGFGGLFGVPIAGALFGIEVQRRSRIHFSSAAPALVASVIAFFVAEACGAHHFATPNLGAINFGWSVLWRCVVAALFFAAVGVAFIQLEHRIKFAMAKVVKYPPIRPVIGGVLILLLTAVAGTREYLGASTSLAEVALTGAVGIAAIAFVWKLVFTAVSLGTGFVGGEVLPLFIIGSLAGAQFARVTDGPVALYAALGLIGVFTAAANTPITCIVIGIELFGWNGFVPYVIVCVIAYFASGEHTVFVNSPIMKRHLKTTPQ